MKNRRLNKFKFNKNGKIKFLQSVFQFNQSVYLEYQIITIYREREREIIVVEDFNRKGGFLLVLHEKIKVIYKKGKF